MKKCGVLLAALILLLVMGCSAPNTKKAEKDQYYEVLSAESGEMVYTITEDTAVEKINDALDSASDQTNEDADTLGLKGTEEYVYVCYQEKTLLAGQSPDEERGYEEICRTTTYVDSPYITTAIPPDMVKSMRIPQEMMNFTLKVPDEGMEVLSNPGQFFETEL